MIWDDNYNIANNSRYPWLVGGDFNVILFEEENIGGLLIHPPEYKRISHGVLIPVSYLISASNVVHLLGGIVE